MIRSPLSGWIGGKYRLMNAIHQRIPADHHTYVEPFAGAAWVLSNREPSKVEILNDINRNVVNLYRVVQHHLDEFTRYFRWVLVSREEFDRWMKVAPDTLTDVQRSARFYYIQKLCYGGRIKSPTFGGGAKTRGRLNLLRLEEDLSMIHLRLARVMIEHLSYEDVIQRYDWQETFFYIDPPYWGCENYYGKNIFSRNDFEKLKSLLNAIKGRFLLSLNDTPEVRQLFGEFVIEPVKVRYSCSRLTQPVAGELFIANYPIHVRRSKGKNSQGCDTDSQTK